MYALELRIFTSLRLLHSARETKCVVFYLPCYTNTLGARDIQMIWNWHPCKIRKGIL